MDIELHKQTLPLAYMQPTVLSLGFFLFKLFFHYPNFFLIYNYFHFSHLRFIQFSSQYSKFTLFFNVSIFEFSFKKTLVFSSTKHIF